MPRAGALYRRRSKRLADAIPAAGRPALTPEPLPQADIHDPDAPGMELPGMDIPGIAAAYGVQSETVKSLSDLTHAVKDALSSDKPRLIEISQRRIGDS
jgi:Thiamine pyrophosphate enzyme, C-terminal TPP binding domain